MCVCKQLAQTCTRQRDGRDSNPRPADRKSGSLTTRPPSRTSLFTERKTKSIASPPCSVVFSARRSSVCPLSPCPSVDGSVRSWSRPTAAPRSVRNSRSPTLRAPIAHGYLMIVVRCQVATTMAGQGSAAGRGTSIPFLSRSPLDPFPLSSFLLYPSLSLSLAFWPFPCPSSCSFVSSFSFSLIQLAKS